MAIEFPADKFVNDTHEYGGMTYVWDGEKWTASGAAAFEDAYVKVEGDIMTGDLKAPNLISEGNVTATGDIIAANGVFEGDVQTTSLNGGPLAGLRNVLINPFMEVTQRGTDQIDTPAVAAQAHYTGADRWVAIPRRSNYVVTTRVYNNSVPASENTPGRNALYVRSTGGSDSFTIAQFVELPLNALGPFQPGTEWTLTVLLRARNTFDLNATLVLSTGSDLGSGGYASSAETITVNAMDWQTCTFHFTLPTDGTWTPGNPCVMVRLNTGQDGTDQEIWLSSAQLEPGPVSTPWEQRPYGLELQLCQRYYQKHFILGKSICMHNSDGDSNTYTDLPLPTPMRTFEVTAGPDLNVGNAISTVGAGARLQDVQYANSACARLRMTKLGTAASGPNYISKIGNGQDYMYLDAEL